MSGTVLIALLVLALEMENINWQSNAMKRVVRQPFQHLHKLAIVVMEDVRWERLWCRKYIVEKYLAMTLITSKF